jgi:hypothetical protein
MFRKSAVVILILLYSASAIGVPLHFHYCRGELKHITFFVKMECHEPGADQAVHACCQGMKAETCSGHTLNNCCDDATQWIQDNLPAICAKNTEDQTNIAQVAVIRLDQTFESKAVYTAGKPSEDVKNNIGIPLYVLQCALIYYG